MIQDIVITRNKVYPRGITSNDSSMVSVNQGLSLLLLEPKFPNLHQTLECFDENNNNLITKNLFNHVNILDSNTLDKFDIRKFNKTNVVTPSSDFLFSRVEPIIIKHKWFNHSKNTKRNLLMVLFNSGECILVNNVNDEWIMTESYFNWCLNQSGLRNDDLEYNLSYEDYIDYKVKDFEICHESNTFTILTESNCFKRFDLNFVLLDEFTVKDNVVSFKYSNEFYVYTTVNNEVIANHDTVIIAKNRFKNTNLEIKDGKIYVTNSNQLTVHDNGKTELFPLSGHWINDFHVFNGTYITSDDNYIFCNDSTIQNIIDRQLKRIKIKNDGKILIYGTTIMSGVLIVVYKTYPINKLNYTILSKQEYKLSFIPIQHTENHNLKLVNNIWFEHYSDIKMFPENSTITYELIDNFLGSLKDLKAEMSLEFKQLHPEFQPKSEFSEYLIANFTTNPDILSLQDVYNFNATIIIGLNALIERLKSISNLDITLLEKCQDYFIKLSEEQTSVQLSIQKFLFQAIINYNYPSQQEIDKFIIGNYNTFLGLPNPYPDLTIDISTSFFKESFKIGSNVSLSDHQWPQCTLTFLPIMDLNSTTDLLNKFHYCCNKDTPFVSELTSTLNYCIITGNRFK